MNDNTVSVKEWLGTLLLLFIPIVNVILMFVWAFGNNTKPSKANFFKAQLIIVAISVAVWTFIGLTLGLSFFSMFV